MEDKKEEFYTRFKKELEENVKWPSLYMYKFILKSNKENDIIELTNKFSDLSPDIITKTSTKGKFTSITIKANMNSADEVIKRYKNIAHLKEVMAL